MKRFIQTQRLLEMHCRPINSNIQLNAIAYFDLHLNDRNRFGYEQKKTRSNSKQTNEIPSVGRPTKNAPK